MAKVSNVAKQKYAEKINAFSEAMSKIQKRQDNIKLTMSDDDAADATKKLALADEELNYASYQLLINEMSVALLGPKNQDALDEARKRWANAVIYLEEVVSNMIDAPFSEIEERLEAIAGFDAAQRWELLRKMGYTLESLQDGYGENNKFRWAFVGYEGRFAAAAKNLLDMKSLQEGLDPRHEHYEAIFSHLRTVKESLSKAGDRYREKYEFVTKRVDDFKLAIRHLEALKRLHQVIGESAQAEELKRKIDVWRGKMDRDAQNADEKAKRQQKKT